MYKAFGIRLTRKFEFTVEMKESSSHIKCIRNHKIFKK